ncbi:hypothetical protein [Leucobacter massiliensis]|uniref:Uncharacterized protein n=1 Tax=Leucobacter massiliensis TaxID=1686285 RepID=A0A2S9QLR5_9MICO|nr:hypothetical protein [Leucobacter massiliensis]PRI10514.1 hypothetical protein B4915_10940 [Leucobacter massiliensis]
MSRMSISLDAESRRRLQHHAADRGISQPGILARVLVEHGLDVLDAADPALIELVDEAMKKERARRQAVGRAAMESRYSQKDDDDAD